MDIQYVPGHKRVLIDSGEFLCECGWVPSWNSNLTLEEQYAEHITE